jgi:hypothetical protein
MSTITDPEELKRLLAEGATIHFDRKNKMFRIYDPRTKARRYVDSSLTSYVAKLYEERKRLREQPPPPSSSSSPSPAVPGPSRQELLKALEDDANSVITIMKSRLDPRAPVMTKFVEDVSWWQHLMLDFSKQAVPEVFSLMGADEVDVRNPEVTAQRMVSKLKAIKEKALRAEELEAKVKTVEEEYKAKLSALEEALRRYKEVIEEQGKVIEDLAERSKKTIAFFMVVLPERLPPETRSLYRKLASEVKALWGVGE